MSDDELPKMNKKFRLVMDDIFMKTLNQCDIGIKMSKLYVVIGAHVGDEKMCRDGEYIIKVFEALRDKTIDAKGLVVEQLNSLQITDEEWQRIEEAYSEITKK